MDMLDDLMAYFKGDSGKKPDSSEQLRRAQEEQKKKVTPRQEAEAKKAGFKTHAEYMAWLRQRQERSGGTTAASGKKAKAGVKTAMGLHPARLLDHVDEAVRGASKPKR